MVRANYNKDDVIKDLATGEMKPSEIAFKHGTTVSAIYAIRSAARREGILNSRGSRTMSERVREESTVLTPELRERVKDMRDQDLTSSEITRILKSEGIVVTFDQVCKIMSRGAQSYTRPKNENMQDKVTRLVKAGFSIEEIYSSMRGFAKDDVRRMIRVAKRGEK